MRRLKIDLEALRRSEAEEDTSTREGLCAEGIRVGSLLVSPEGVMNANSGVASPPCLLSLQDLILEPDAEHSLLGKGSSGSVRRCINRRTGDVLAVKEVKVTSQAHLDEIRRELAALYTPHDLADGSWSESRAKQTHLAPPASATATASPQSPSTPSCSQSPTFTGDCAQLVKFYGAFSFEGSAFMAIECLDGSLSDIHEPVPTATLAHMTRSMLQGLVYLHRARHLIHRDLKPSNVLFRVATGEIKITDFGVSSNLECSKGDAHTFVGTVTYMSPERLRGGSYSFSADIWSLGLVVAELAFGMCPYESLRGDSAEARFWALLQHLSRDEPALNLPDDMDPNLADFIQQCVQKTPELRPNSVELLSHPFITTHCTAPATDTGDMEDRECIGAWLTARESRRRRTNGRSAYSGPLPQTSLSHGIGDLDCAANGISDPEALQGAHSGSHDSTAVHDANQDGGMNFCSDTDSAANLSVNLDEELDKLLF